MISSFLRKTEFSEPETAYAHCDIPCGVYEPDSMKWAAQTAYMMTTKLKELSGDDTVEREHTIARMTAVKEEFAQKCKHEILVLWTDYFKPEHFEKWPDLTEKVHKAAKQCSIVKREINVEAAEKLKQMVDELGKIFVESKQ